MASTAHARTVALTLILSLLTLLEVFAAPPVRAAAGAGALDAGAAATDAVAPDTAAAVTGEATTPGVIPYAATEGPLFTRPPDTGGTRDQELAWNQVVERLLDASPAGSTVTGSLFSLTSPASQAALKRADRRGVNVRLLLYNRRADNKKTQALVRALNHGHSAGSWAKVCIGSCYGRVTKKGNYGVQHFKAFTFTTVMETSTRASTNVWTAGSGNLTKGGSAFNSYVVNKFNPKIVAALNAYMVGMRADKQSRPAITRTVEEDGYKFYLYPQQNLTPDVISETLKATTCVAPAGYGRNGRTLVRVGMFTWTPFRKLDLELVRLHKAGCDVQVIVSAPTINKVVMRHLVRGGVPVYNTHHYHGRVFYYVHDKNLIIDGMIGGSPLSQVQTGSNNFTDGGLTRNTESIIQIRNKATTNQFLANWTLIKSYSEPVTKLAQLSAQSTEPLDPDNMEPTR